LKRCEGLSGDSGWPDIREIRVTRLTWFPISGAGKTLIQPLHGWPSTFRLLQTTFSY